MTGQNGNNGNGRYHINNIVDQFRDTDPSELDPDDEKTSPALEVEREMEVANDPISKMFVMIMRAVTELNDTVQALRDSVTDQYQLIGRKQAELERRQNGLRDEINYLKARYNSENNSAE